MQNISEEIFLLLSLIESYCFYRVINTVFLMKIQWKLPYIYFLRDACSRLPPADVVTVTTLLVSEFLFPKAESAEQPHGEWACSSATSPGEGSAGESLGTQAGGDSQNRPMGSTATCVRSFHVRALLLSAAAGWYSCTHIDRGCICSITPCSTDSRNFPWAQCIWRLLYSFKTILERQH